MPQSLFLLSFALLSQVAAMRALIGLYVFESPVLIAYRVQFLACAAAMGCSCDHDDTFVAWWVATV